MEKHAFMIMAHNDQKMLSLLLSSLDNARNDIYVHIDAKNTEIDVKEIKKAVTNAHVYVFQKFDCRWGDYSLVECELFLLKQAVKSSHKYYHLLSGSDYLIKNVNDIYNFFEENEGFEFIFFTSRTMDESHKNWYRKYHFFQGYCKGNRFTVLNSLFQKAEKLILICQRAMRINRKTYYPEIFKGSQWFSITEKFAMYVISQETHIRHDFHFTFASDEMVFQTVLMNSEFKDNLFVKSFDNSMRQNQRFIIFKNGVPKNLDDKDVEVALNSGCLFARKFSSNNAETINMISRKIS